MSRKEKKKVDILFISEDFPRKNVLLDGSSNPIAERTRSKTKCSPATKSKSCSSAQTTRRSTRHISIISSNSAQIFDKTPSPNRTPSSVKRSFKKSDKNSPYITKTFKPGCTSREGKVSPLKICRPLSRNCSPSDDSSISEGSTPKATSKRSPRLREFESSDDVFRSSRKKKTPLKEKQSAQAISEYRTPKTPRIINDSPSATPTTRSRSRPIQNLTITPVTPRSRRVLFSGNPETPGPTRSKLKKEIQTKKMKVTNNLEGSDSEYSLEEEESDSDHEKIESDSEIENTPAKRSKLSMLRNSAIFSPSTSYQITPQKKVTHHNAVMLDSEKYFEKKSQKNIISNNIFSNLPLPEICPTNFSEMTWKSYVKHKNEIDRSSKKYKEQFNKWLLHLKEGFNLMLHGLGSKLEILAEFHAEKLSSYHVLTVNGFNTNLSINEMVKTFVKQILQISRCPANINEALDLADEELNRNKFPVFIIINNIDGIALRGSKKQAILSKLAKLPHVHIIATSDHINAPLLWGNNKMSDFNFVWLDVTTFNPYTTEISYQKSIDIENFGPDSSLELLNQVFNWQNQRNKEVFQLIMKDFLNNKHKKNFKGTLTSELLRLAAKNLSISSRSALITALTDFIDSNIIYVEHNYLKFLISPNILQSFYNQNFV